MQALDAALPGAFEASVVERGGEKLAAAFSFRFRGAIHPFYAGGTRAGRELGASDFLFLRLMGRGRDLGCTRFAFGRSRVGTGSHAHRKSWGFVPRPLAYRYFLQGRDAPPRTDPSNPRYRSLVAAWRMLPLPVANAIGPLVARQLA
ncbi:MAG: GNAT family N-acetyltransferase, partial [Alphaproteobacteria bacterium]|nr:GNAT family N-acetyltransferase [Alphaproteobacteria bacterium]